jgi:aspartate/tyrosine/aromatic aminotransferase
MFEAVRLAEAAILRTEGRDKEYPTIQGNPEFTREARRLVFGSLPEQQDESIVTV